MQIHATCGKGINSLAEPFMDFVQHSLSLHHRQRPPQKVSANLMDLHTRLAGFEQKIKTKQLHTQKKYTNNLNYKPCPISAVICPGPGWTNWNSSPAWNFWEQHVRKQRTRLLLHLWGDKFLFVQRSQSIIVLMWPQPEAARKLIMHYAGTWPPVSFRSTRAVSWRWRWSVLLPTHTQPVAICPQTGKWKLRSWRWTIMEDMG